MDPDVEPSPCEQSSSQAIEPGPSHIQPTTSGLSSDQPCASSNPRPASRKRRFHAASAVAYARANAAASAHGDNECPSESVFPALKKVQKTDFNWTSKMKSPLKPVKDRDIPEKNIENGTPFQVYAQTCDLDSFINLVVTESNRYAHQQGIEFYTDAEEMKSFFGI